MIGSSRDRSRRGRPKWMPRNERTDPAGRSAPPAPQIDTSKWSARDREAWAALSNAGASSPLSGISGRMGVAGLDVVDGVRH